MTTAAEALAAETPAPAAAAAETPAPAAETPAPTGEKPWYQDVVPADRHDYVVNKGWKSPSDLFDSYSNIEKTLGLPADARADALLVRPKADATAEQQAEFLAKANSAFVPEKPEGYALGVKTEELPAEVQQSLAWMHGAGVPQPMAAKLVENYTAANKVAEDAFEAQSIKDMTDLATEFGDKAEDNFELGRRAFRAAREQAGLDEKAMQAIERVVGTKMLMKLFISQGRNLVEAPGGGAPGNQGNTGNGFVLSPEGAKAAVQAKYNDSAFMARYTSPNIGVRQMAIAEMELLQKAATGTT